MGKRQDYILKQQGKEAFFAGNYIEAIAKFSEAIQLVPNDPNLYGLRSASYNKNLQFDLALKDVDKMLELRPYNYQAHLMKGSCHFSLNEIDNAIEAYKKALQSKPTPRIAQYINKALKKIADAKKRKSSSPTSERPAYSPNFAASSSDKMSLLPGSKPSYNSAAAMSTDRLSMLQTEKPTEGQLKFRQAVAALLAQAWYRGYKARKVHGPKIAKIRKKVQQQLERKKQLEEKKRKREELAAKKKKEAEDKKRKEAEERQKILEERQRQSDEIQRLKEEQEQLKKAKQEEEKRKAEEELKRIEAEKQLQEVQKKMQEDKPSERDLRKSQSMIEKSTTRNTSPTKVRTYSGEIPKRKNNSSKEQVAVFRLKGNFVSPKTMERYAQLTAIYLSAVPIAEDE